MLSDSNRKLSNVLTVNSPQVLKNAFLSQQKIANESATRSLWSIFCAITDRVHLKEADAHQ
jgi:hypothetical protein